MNEPIHILSLGAGVQSSTLALMAATGEVTPMPKFAIFADTQAEPKSVYTWLDWLEKQLPFQVHRVTAGSLIEDVTTLREKKDKSGFYVHSNIPAFVRNPNGSHGMMPRQCTTNFKIEPLRRAVKKLAGVPRCCKTVSVVQWIGISVDEIYRMKESRDKWQRNRWPLVELGMKRHDCLRWMEKRGHPTPPRSACFFCPYHSNSEWRRLRDEEPQDFARAVSLEKEFSALKQKARVKGEIFFHAQRVPLDQVDFSTEEDHGQTDMFQNECEGMCGV